MENAKIKSQKSKLRSRFAVYFEEHDGLPGFCDFAFRSLHFDFLAAFTLPGGRTMAAIRSLALDRRSGDPGDIW